MNNAVQNMARARQAKQRSWGCRIANPFGVVRK